MFPSNLAIKTTAKQALSRVWPRAVAIVFILAGAFFLPYAITSFLDVITASAVSAHPEISAIISLVYGFFIMFPLFFGALRWVWGVTALADMPLVTIFIPFSSPREYSVALRIYWAYFWRIQLALLPYNLSLSLNYIDASLLPQLSDLETVISLVQSGCTVFSLAAAIVIFIRLIPLPFLAINHPYEQIRENVKESRTVFKATGIAYFPFVFSVLGWLALSLLFIPIFYTIPFVLASWAVLVRFSINHCIFGKK